MGRAVAPLLSRAASPSACCSAMLVSDPIAVLLRCRCRCDSAWEVRGANRTVIRCPSHALANGRTHRQRCVGMNARGTESDMTGKTKKWKPEFRRLRDIIVISCSNEHYVTLHAHCVFMLSTLRPRMQELIKVTEKTAKRSTLLSDRSRVSTQKPV